MAIQSNFPAIKPTLLLDFANTEQLDPRITFTRASTATYYGTQTAKAEQNLLLQSQDFDNATWAKDGTTVTGNTISAPDGTTTADTITNTITINAHVIQQGSISIVSMLSYTISVFAKKNTNDFLQITTFGSGNPLGTGRANFDLATGVVGSVDGGTSTITDAGGGWYRCSYTVIASASGTITVYCGIAPSSTAARFASYLGLGTESIYLWGAQTEQRSTVTAYTPTTTQPITNYIPVLQTAASGVARFDHNPNTFESLGLLIEEQRTNLQINSENVDGANWGKSAITSQLNIAIAPDGTQTADKIIPNTTNSAHHVESGTTVVAGTQYTASVYLKAAEETVAVLWNNVAGAVATFNLSTGTVTSGTGVITPVGNGWYRCSILYTPSGTAGQIRYYPRQSTAFTGNDFNGIYIWGAQLEAGAFPTSYIPTVASQVTRAADSASMTGTNFSSWYNVAEGTVYAEFGPYGNGGGASNPGVIQIDNGAAANSVRIFAGSSTVPVFNVTSNGVTQAYLSTGTLNPSVSSKVTGAYKVNDFARSVNNATSDLDAIGTVPVTVNRVTIGVGNSGVGYLNGTIRKIAYYPLRVTNAQLQGLTS